MELPESSGHMAAVVIRRKMSTSPYAGGRKTMSALMTIAAQIYGARVLCHVVPLDEDLERQG